MEQRLIIIQESFKLFHRYGIKSVTMDDIAKHLGVSKKTLYKHFDMKDSIVHAVTQMQIDFSICSCQDAKIKSENALHELVNLMTVLRELFKEMNPALLYDLQKYHPVSWNLLMNHQKQFLYNEIIENLKRGIEEGVYRNDFSVEVIALLRLHEIQLTFNPEAFPPNEFKIEDVQISLLDHYMMGIVTIEGYKLAQSYKNRNDDK
jgi:TetR/AcrR family transcriptional regulator, cholesterol catabolism regulator